MNSLFDEISSLIGRDFIDIGARFLAEEKHGDYSVFFLATPSRMIAISHSPRDDVSCRVSPSQTSSYLNYSQWPTLWHGIGLDKYADTPDGLRQYMALFPDRFEDYILFMGKCLRKYFLGN